METDVHLWPYLAKFFLEWEMFQTKVVQKIKTHILCSIRCSRKSWRLWENVEKYSRAGQAPDEDTRCMHIACCMPKATNALPEYVTLIAFPRQQSLTRTRVNSTLYVHWPVLLLLRERDVCNDHPILEDWWPVTIMFVVLAQKAHKTQQQDQQAECDT
jgi:hypothetical protein